jgi:hypothetical protein
MTVSKESQIRVRPMSENDLTEVRPLLAQLGHELSPDEVKAILYRSR